MNKTDVLLFSKNAYTAKNASRYSRLLNTVLINAILSALFIRVNNVEQYCYTLISLNNVVEYC